MTIRRIFLVILLQLCLQMGASVFAYAQEAAVSPAREITIPSGTEIAVRTIDRIDSRKTELNHKYAGSLHDPVIVDARR